MTQTTGNRILEVRGIQKALSELCCKKCKGGPLLFRESLIQRKGLCTHPYIYCGKCKTSIQIPFAKIGESKICSKSVFANKCAGSSQSSLEMFCALMDLPQPLSKNHYTELLPKLQSFVLK